MSENFYLFFASVFIKMIMCDQLLTAMVLQRDKNIG